MNKYKDAVPAVAVTVAAASCITEAKNIGLSGNGSIQSSSRLSNYCSGNCSTANSICDSNSICSGGQSSCSCSRSTRRGP